MVMLEGLRPSKTLYIHIWGLCLSLMLLLNIPPKAPFTDSSDGIMV